jgi:hypothetical protein
MRHAGKLVKSCTCAGALNVSTFRQKQSMRVLANVLEKKSTAYIYMCNIYAELKPCVIMPCYRTPMCWEKSPDEWI